MPHFEWTTLAQLMVQMGAILLSARLLAALTRRLGQPTVIAEVVAGIALGPSLLGLIWPGAMQALFPAHSLATLGIVSQIGLVLFMFLVGLELDPKLLHGRTTSSFVISAMSVVVPFGLGVVLAWVLWADYAPKAVPVFTFMLFLGTALSVTAFPVLARILAERHLLQSRVGAISMAAAAVGDVSAWCLLAFVVSVARSRGPADALWTTLLTAVFIAIMLALVRPLLRQLGARVSSREGLTPGMMGLILLMLLLSSTITEVIGIHALFGAFLFGAILPKEGRFAEALAERVETVAVVLLLPLFFAFSGLRTQIGLVSGTTAWLITGLLIAVATAGKFGGSAIAARLTGLSWRESGAIGVLMNTRGLMELVVLNIGMDLGVISPAVFTMLVIVALVTTVATTPLLQLFYPNVLPGGLAPTIEGPAASFRILMCVTDGATGPAMARVGRALVQPTKEGAPAQVTALTLWQPGLRLSLEKRRGEQLGQSGPLQPLLETSRKLALDVDALAFASVDPAADICRTAIAEEVSLIMLGSHKPVLIGGQLSGAVREVLEQADCETCVLMDRGIQSVKKVLVAIAGNADDLPALRMADRMQRVGSVELTLLHVVAPESAAQIGAGRVQLDEFFPAGQEKSRDVRLLVVESDQPPQAVLEEAGNGYDLLLLGFSETWGLGARLGKERILAESPVSVLAIHCPPAPARSDSGIVNESVRQTNDR